MSNLKRFTSILAAVTIGVSSVASISYASVPSDVIDSKYEEAAKVLGALDIMVGDAGTGLFRPEDAIKRSEVTKVAVALKGLTDVADSSSSITKFPDVGTNHWANGYINVGTTEGLIIGDDKGNFRPDDQITYAEAVTILVRALGYEPQATQKGGFPSGYLVTGSSTGLTKGVSAATNKLISRGDVAQLANNALTIKLMEQVGFGANAKYEVVDKTLLADSLGVKLVSGVVKAVGNASIDGNNIDKNSIKIGDSIYKTGDADVRNVLGFNVDAYIVNKGKDKDTLLVAVPSEGENSVVKITADNLNSIKDSGSSKVINFAEGGNGKTDKITISKDATVIYNGMLGTWDDLKEINEGSIILLDAERSNNYNMVFVNETVNYVVDEVSESSSKITDKYEQDALLLDKKDDSMSFIIDKNNKAIDISELEEWDVITLTISKDKKLVYGTVIQHAIEGEITEQDKDGFYIDGKKYKVASNYPSTLEISDKGTFYLDAEGKIAAFDNEKNDIGSYAFLSDIGLKSGLSDTLEIEILNSEGKLQTLKAAKKVTVDGKSSMTYKEIFDKFNNKSQLVTFELNSKGEVIEINTAKESAEINEDEFVLNFTEEEVEFKSSTSKLLADAMNVRVGSNTLIFDIPSDAEDSEDYAVRDRSFFADGGKYNIKVFNVAENLTAGIIIVTESDTKASEESSVAVVDRVAKSTNKDGDNIEKLYAFADGKEVTLSTTKTGILKKGSKVLETGDIIQYKTNANGEIDAVTVLFDIANIEKEETVEHSKNMTTAYGKVTKKFSDSFNLSVNDGDVQNYEIGDAKIYIVDEIKSSKKISVGNSSDIQKFDESDPERVFVRIYKDIVTEIIIIK